MTETFNLHLPNRRRQGCIMPPEYKGWFHRFMEQQQMSQQESTNPKDKIGRTKPALHLIPGTAQVQEAVVMKLGADKYGPYNWRDGTVAASVYVAAALRHLHSWFDGKDLDDESNASHLAHARACLGILLDAEAQGTLVDDRPEPGQTADLIQLETVLNQANKPDQEEPEVTYEDVEQAIPWKNHTGVYEPTTATEATAGESVVSFDKLKKLYDDLFVLPVFEPLPQPEFLHGIPVRYVDKLDDRSDAAAYSFICFGKPDPIAVKAVETTPRTWYNNQQGETSQNLEEVTVRPRKLRSDEVKVAVQGLEDQGCRTSVAHEIVSGVSVPDNNYTKGGVYVAGPMRGYEKFNFPAFCEACDRLVEQGWLVISPADIDRAAGMNEDDPSEGSQDKQATIVYRDFHSLFSLDPKNGDAIAMLPGWEKSTGAVAEFFLARWLGLKVIDAETGEDELEEIDTCNLINGAVNYAFNR